MPTSSKRKNKTHSQARSWLMPIFVAAVLSLAAFLLYRTLSRYSLEELITSIKAFPLAKLGLAACFAAASYLCLTGFDTMALRYVGKPLPYPKIALASFTSLSLGHNIGVAALSSGAVRYRFYSRWGLTLGEVAKLIVFCGVTVGLGLILLGGIAILARPDLAEKVTGLARSLVIALGLGCVSLCVLYLAMAALRKEPFRFRKFSFDFPSLPLAACQLVLGPLNFACVAACLHQALSAAAELNYLETATVYVIANVTSLLSHVPGGLGVIESVVLVLMPGANLIGALLVFRFVYFLVPLVLGASLFGITELVYRAASHERPAAQRHALQAG